MTKTVLNTLWLTGGGLVATWFAVSPIITTPADVSSGGNVRRAVQETSVDGVNTSELKVHHAMVLKPATRNPFEFGRAPAPARGRADVVAAAPVMPQPVDVPPSLALSGIADQKTREGSHRTAIISGDSQLYLVGEGETVAGRYRVVTVGEDSVVLQDNAGQELRLTLK